MSNPNPTTIWPTGTDYAQALQMPSVSFTDDELAAGRPGLNPMGMPLVASGQNAVVFLVETHVGRRAVRCFLTPPHEGAARYEALERHLLDTAPRAITPARWLPGGISVAGRTWPVVVMPWVEGVPMNVAVEDMVGDAIRLRSLATQWAEVVSSLQRARVAHGDLQHGNVLVKDHDRIALVDLDGVWVPEIQVGPPVEFGHPNYQHRERTVAHWGEFVDSFPGALIELALRALAVDPSLERFLSGENLLFARRDLERPVESDAWTAVCASPDPEVATLALRLRDLASGPITDVLVPFDALRAGLEATVVRPASPPVVVAPAPPPVQVVAQPAPAANDNWWQDDRAAPAVADPVAVMPSAPTVTTPTQGELGLAMVLGGKLPMACAVGGALAGALGSLATGLVDPYLDEVQETGAFVLLIALLLGGCLQSIQSALGRLWGAAARRFIVGGLVGGVAGMVALAPADALVSALAKDTSTSALGGQALYAAMEDVAGGRQVPFVGNVLMFVVVSASVAFAIGALRSIRSAAWGAAAGVLGGAVGGLIFGQTVAKWDGTALDVKFLRADTVVVVALVCAFIGLSYGTMIRARRRASLMIIEGVNAGLEIVIDGSSATVGSAGVCDLVIKGDDRVRPMHALIELDSNPPTLSVNGPTLLNGRAVDSSSAVTNGDVMMVGGSFIRIEMAEV